MTWRVEVGNAARRSIKKLPKKDAVRVAQVLIEMRINPFAGDIVALRGTHQSAFRRRVGSWRLIFEIETKRRVVKIDDVLRRTSKTY